VLLLTSISEATALAELEQIAKAVLCDGVHVVSSSRLMYDST